MAIPSLVVDAHGYVPVPRARVRCLPGRGLPLRHRAKPPEYSRRRCYISFDPDESRLAFTADHPLVGAERIIWASDYPHPDAKFPGVVKELSEATEALTDARRAGIFGGNAWDVYALPDVGLERGS